VYRCSAGQDALGEGPGPEKTFLILALTLILNLILPLILTLPPHSVPVGRSVDGYGYGYGAGGAGATVPSIG
jgi:hypothetical protein